MLLTNATLATLQPGAAYGLISDGAIAIQDGKIHWCGPRAEVPQNLASLPSQDMGGRLITPALIDCHTQIVHGGQRANEFEMRLKGESYAAISRAGGGIVSTVSATRAATEADLVSSALPRVDALLAESTSVIEVK